MVPDPKPAPNLAESLPRDAYYDIVHTLRGMLPPPATDTPEALLRRDRVAIAQVAALLPANPAEAHLAATFVGANTYALDCMRLARVNSAVPEVIGKCLAQSAMMSRQAQGALRALVLAQNTRRKLEADTVSADRAAWTEHCALNLMAQSLPNGESAAPAEPPAPMSQPPAPAPSAAPAVVAPDPAAEPVRLPIAEAEHYALLYPKRAELIRRHRRMPDDARFGPPEEDVIRALVTGQTAALMALDHSRAA